MSNDPTMAPLRTKDITKPTAFSIAPDATTRSALATELDITSVRKLRFEGEIAPEGPTDLRLTATLGATVAQPCVVTLEPVTTRIDESVSRLFSTEIPEIPEGDEVEMPEDDTVEPLPDEIDLSAIMSEALALALPAWPRAEGVDPIDISVTEPGKTAMTDDDAKPFAGLKALRDKLDDPDQEG